MGRGAWPGVVANTYNFSTQEALRQDCYVFKDSLAYTPSPRHSHRRQNALRVQGTQKAGGGSGIGGWREHGLQDLSIEKKKKGLEATHHPNPEAPGKQPLPEKKQVPTGFIFLLRSSGRRDCALTPTPISPLPLHLGSEVGDSLEPEGFC